MTDRMHVDPSVIRANHPLPAVVGSSVKLLRAGNEWKGCCPFHDDRSPSFTIFAGGERFHCFGCEASGDVLDYVQRAFRLTFLEAVAMLQGGTLAPDAPRVLSPLLAKDTTPLAASIWQSASSINGTPAESYLRSRGLHLPLPCTLRFARLPYPHETGRLPCLVALISDINDQPVGIQRTFVREDGSGKADVPTPKLSLGRVRGGAIRLAPVAAELVVTGGLEDGLTLQQELGRAVWAATGEGNMANMVLPETVRSVTIGADNDESGERHAMRAAEAFSLQGRDVRIMRPFTGFKDFNDELRGDRA